MIITTNLQSTTGVIITTNLLYFFDPFGHILPQGVEEGGVAHHAVKVFNSGTLTLHGGSLDDGLEVWVDAQRYIRDVYVLLKVKQTDLQFIHLLLHRWYQFVPFTGGGGETRTLFEDNQKG